MRRTALALVCAWLTGCYASHSVRCEDGRLCPEGTACDPARLACLAPEQVSACAGAVDGAACAYPGVADGRCVAEICRAVRCGDSYRELDEVCDDGNEIDGDGCSATCNSRELCGEPAEPGSPLVVDLSVGEQCDDGNRLSHDGCASNCRRESPAWTDISASTDFELRPELMSKMVYDPVRDRLLLFGGFRGNNPWNETWEWDGHSWQRRLPASTPHGRVHHAMTYDARRRTVLLFGGRDDHTRFGDTWEWDGVDWHFRDVPGPPPGIGLLAYDSRRGKAVLLAATTWEWDGEHWEMMEPAIAPTDGALMAFDPTAGVVVVLTRQGDTWTWNGATWASVGTGGPTFEFSITGSAPSMLVDPITSRLTIASADAFHVWDGAEWVKTPFVGPGPGATGVVYAADLRRRRILAYSGYQPRPAETWAWDGNHWALLPENPQPTFGGAAVFDSLNGRVVMIRSDGTVVLWDGGLWSVVPLANGPPGAGAAAFDERRGRLVVGGGGGVWEWDGQSPSWDHLVPESGPDGYSVMAYDRARGEVLVVSMVTRESPIETWTWNGSVWTQVAMDHPPAGFQIPIDLAMVYDDARARVVLSGGGDADIPSDAGVWTWLWDGVQWTEAQPTIEPPARGMHALAYDAAAAKVVMYGGESALDVPFQANLEDTWEWDGSGWNQRAELPRAPGIRKFAKATYDPIHRRVLLFGGDVAERELWQYRRDSGHASEDCRSGYDADRDGLVGCADPDCWASCTPLCPPGTASCPASSPRCGDATCSVLETCRSCASDCGECTPLCGDFLCDTEESPPACPGDCIDP